MGQYGNVLFASDKVHTVPQSALHCRSGLGGLNQMYRSNCPNHSVSNICGIEQDNLNECVVWTGLPQIS